MSVPTIRSNGRGTLIIRRRYNGIRIRRASGTDDRETFKQILSALKLLAIQGKTRILEAIRDGLMKPMNVYEKVLADEPVIHVKDVQRLKGTSEDGKAISILFDWATNHRAEPKTREEYRYCFQVLLKFASEESTLADLPAVLRKMRDAYQKRGTLTMFNRTGKLPYRVDN